MQVEGVKHSELPIVGGLCSLVHLRTLDWNPEPLGRPVLAAKCHLRVVPPFAKVQAGKFAHGRANRE